MNKNSLLLLLLTPALAIPTLNWAASPGPDLPYEFIPGVAHDYARNAEQVFRWNCTSSPQLTSHHCWQAMAGTEPESFSPVAFIPPGEGAAVSSPYTKDERGVYFNGARLAVADPAQFKVLGEQWAATPQQVIYAGAPRSQVDAASLQILDHGWARDKTRVYYLGDTVADANPASLHVLNAQYAADDAHVFYRSKPLANLDANSFQALGQTGYARDSTSVFHAGQKIPDADSASFTLIATEAGDCYARDAHRVYYCGKPVTLGDAESFVVLDSFFAIDNERVYFGGTPVEVADRGTFRNFQPEHAPPTEVRANAEDKHNWYEVVQSGLIVTPKSARTRRAAESQ